MTKAREPIVTNIGKYLKALRNHNRITRKIVATRMGLSVQTIANVEDGYNPPPDEKRLRLWMRTLGESKRTPEALKLLRQVRRSRSVRYKPKHVANEHLDRIIDAYDNNTLDEADVKLMKLIAPRSYN